MTLVRDGLTDEQSERRAVGWHHYVDRLEQLASTGTIEPDDWAWAPETLDPFTAADAVLAAIQPVLRSLTPDDQPKPTPCRDLACHELAEHLMTSLSQLGAMAGADEVNLQAGSLETRPSVMAGQAIDGWHRRGQAG